VRDPALSAKTRFLKVAPSIYRHYRILPDGSKGEGTGSYFLYLWKNGHQIKESLGEDFETAKLEAKKRRLALEREDVRQRSLTLESATLRYFGGREHLSKSSRALDHRIRDRIFKTFPRGIHHPIRSYKLTEIERWLATLQKFDTTRAKVRGELSPSAKNKIILALKNIFKRAMLDGARADNPCDHLRYIPRAEPKRLTPTWAEFLAIVGAIRDSKHSDTGDESADWIEFSARAGLGRAEINGLTWGDIDLARGEMWVRRRKTKRNFPYILHPLVTGFLEKLRERKNPKPSEKLFSIKEPKGSYARACARLKLPRYEPRALRRLHIRVCMEQGVDPEVIAQNQGHTDSGRLIRTIYYTARPEFARAQFAKLKEPTG
jgi:integrase